MLQNRYHSIMNRVDTFLAEGNKTLALAIIARLNRVLSIIKPESNVFSSPVGSKARKPEKPVKMLSNHRPPVIGKLDFSSPAYTFARRIVSGKIKRARRDGVQDAQNVYLQYYADMIQTAYVAVIESFEEGERIASLMPSGYDITDSEPWNIIEENAYSNGFQTLGRYAYNIEKRAKEGTPIEHVSDNLKTSSFERNIATADSLKVFRADLEKVILGMNLTAKTKRAFLEHFRANKLTDIQRRELLRRAIDAGIIATDRTGKAYIND